MDFKLDITFFINILMYQVQLSIAEMVGYCSQIVILYRFVLGLIVDLLYNLATIII